MLAIVVGALSLSGCSRPEVDAWNRGCAALQDMVAAAGHGNLSRAHSDLLTAVGQAQKSAKAAGDDFHQRFADDVTHLQSLTQDSGGAINIPRANELIDTYCTHGDK